ncbi:hypothetical protein [Mesorhizobium neociceri]|uniref:Uncharacterized protein n=1 Tax=Mesorhizobium neociceri TaxID=1307853 RepID=A0A838B0V0_9HYPH|nr:hypothetical protein [Mesorhizobium neociceri]MBA1139464.1 hypothetical protein [Mesorhizobium neociceri]
MKFGALVADGITLFASNEPTNRNAVHGAADVEIAPIGETRTPTGPAHPEQRVQLEINGEHYTTKVELTPNPDVVFGQLRQAYLIHNPQDG